MKLSQNFNIDEFVHSDIAIRTGISNDPSGDVIVNLRRLAEFLEKVRALFNKPIRITSGYRSPEVNALLGSKPTSQHCIGCAADIRIDGLTPDQIVKAISKSDIKYDQLIREFDSWVHISIPANDTVKPRHQTLIIDKNGTRPYG